MNKKTLPTLGNVIGSNIFNIAVILGLCAIIRPMPITGNTIKLEYPVLALVLFMTVFAAVTWQLFRRKGSDFDHTARLPMADADQEG